MSYFFCLATPPQITEVNIINSFDSPVWLTEAAGTYIGNLTRGKQENWSAKIVWSGSSSHALMNGKREVLASALKKLLQNEDCREIRFMVHLFTGSIATEEFELKQQTRVHPEAVDSIVENIELDVRYVIAKRYSWEKL